MGAPNQNIQTIPIPEDCCQQVFNIIVKHLLTQNKKAVNDDGICQYLTNDGCQCAVGCLIRSDLYDPNFENKGLESVNGLKDAILLSLGWHIDYDEKDVDIRCHQVELFTGMINMLIDLQYTHDYHAPVNWMYELTQRAVQYRLTMPDLN